MPTQAVSGRVRLGILALPVTGVLFLIATVVDGSAVNSLDSVRAFAEYESSTNAAVSAFLSSLGNLLSIFGFVALYACMASGRAERWAFFGMVLCVAGTASAFAASAGASGVEAVAAEQYLKGQQAVFEVWYDLFDWTSIFRTVLQVGLFPIGYVLLGVAIWRSQTLPQGAAILWLASLLFFFVSPLTWWAWAFYALSIMAAGGWISWTVWQQPAHTVAGAEAQTRVQ